MQVIITKKKREKRKRKKREKEEGKERKGKERKQLDWHNYNIKPWTKNILFTINLVCN